MHISKMTYREIEHKEESDGIIADEWQHMEILLLTCMRRKVGRGERGRAMGKKRNDRWYHTKRRGKQHKGGSNS